MNKTDDKQLEEAIKVLRDIKDGSNICLTIELERDEKSQEEIKHYEKEVEAIETVLKELEKLQEENNKLERANKTYINSIQSITPVLLEDYIEKDKIREKLKEHKDYLLNQATTSNPTLDAHFRDKENYVIKILKELLEGK